MDPRTLIVRQYFAAFDERDPDLIAASVSTDFVNEHTSALGASSAGRTEYRSRLPGFLQMFQDLHYELIDAIADRNQVAARYRMTATYDGQPIDIPGVMWFVIRNGLIAHRADFWDSQTFLAQSDGGRSD